MLHEPASPVVPKRLHKVRVCGSGELPEHAANFSWPTMEQYNELGLTKPLKLTGVKTRGDGDLVAIQLLFEGGI